VEFLGWLCVVKNIKIAFSDRIVYRSLGGPDPMIFLCVLGIILFSMVFK
jgi:hypothetical protein